MRIFRAHHEAPPIQNPTLAGLAREWVATNASAEYHRQVQRLHIPGCLTPGDVVDAIDQSAADYPARDRLLLTLINADTYLALRILLQAFLPKLLSQASRYATASDLDTHLQNRISEFWDVAANYPRHITKNVPMELLRRLRWHRSDGTRGWGYEPETEGHLTLEEQLTDDVLRHGDEQGPEALAGLFADALSSGTVTQDELDLLSEIYLHGFTAAEAAEQLGASAATIRKRCQRTRERLAEVGQLATL